MNPPDKCPQCGGALEERSGKYGKFLGCSNFPQCRYTYDLSEQIKIECPKYGKLLKLN